MNSYKQHKRYVELTSMENPFKDLGNGVLLRGYNDPPNRMGMVDLAFFSETPLHYHNRSKEMFVPRTRGRIEVDGTVSELVPGKCFIVLPREKHRLLPDGDNPLEVMLMSMPPLDMEKDEFYD